MSVDVLSALSLELLRQGFSVRLRATGCSMEPTIRAGEIIVVEPLPPDQVRAGEVVLFSTGRGLTAHRVVEIPGDDRGDPSQRVLLSRGDADDTGIEPLLGEQVLGRVVSIERNGRCVPVPAPRPPRLRALVRYARRLGIL